MVAVRRRGHRIGWLFLGMGLVAALTGFGVQYAVRAGVTARGRRLAAGDGRGLDLAAQLRWS